MSEIGVEPCFRENLSTFVGDQPANEETVRPVEPTKPTHSAFFDLKTKRLILNDDGMMSGDAKPPSRFNQHPLEKTPEQMLHDINEKLQLNAARRERFLENIVLKSRRIIEKVQKVRDRLTRRQTETCQNTMNTLHNKRQAAEVVRERLLQHKMERIRQRLEHVTVVRGKKVTMKQESSDPSSTDDDTSKEPQSTQPNTTEA